MGSQKESSNRGQKRKKRKFNFKKGKGSNKTTTTEQAAIVTPSPKKSRSISDKVCASNSVSDSSNLPDSSTIPSIRDIFTRSSVPDSSNVPDISTVTSIRDTARYKTQSTGAQDNTSCAKDNVRICYCDRHKCPKDCDVCQPNNPCEKHVAIQCSTDGCYREFHKECVLRSGKDPEGYSCIQCSIPSVKTSIPWEKVSLKEKCERFGLLTPFNRYHEFYDPHYINKKKEVTALKRKITRAYKVFTELDIPTDVKEGILNNDPLAYPTVANMTKASLVRHTISGRRFEMSMLMFQMKSCDCCGRVEPQHVDPLLCLEDMPFQRTFYHKNFFDAYECNCKEICGCQQFYSMSRSLHKDWFYEKYKWSLDDVKPNASLCKFCHNDFDSKDLDTSFEIGKTFSSRNSFGPVQYISDGLVNANIEVDENYKIAHELQHLLLSFTIVEEAAIRSIVPLMSIIRLMHGSIKTKGNTSCVWQQSELSTVLPNLPSECKFIIINRRNKNGEKGKSEMSSTKFERKKIETALKLLSKTVPGVWKDDPQHAAFNIRIDWNKLKAWPERGDITDLEDIPTIYEMNDKGDEILLEEVTNNPYKKYHFSSRQVT